MGEPFKPNLKAHELPRDTLVELWCRTEQAHEKLCETWFAAVAERYGRDVADAVALGGWPLKKAGATPKELFFDDLRFIVAATELQPDMLTVADRDQAERALGSRPGWAAPAELEVCCEAKASISGSWCSSRRGRPRKGRTRRKSTPKLSSTRWPMPTTQRRWDCCGTMRPLLTCSLPTAGTRASENVTETRQRRSSKRTCGSTAARPSTT
jgi:hypothetical protein